MRLAPFHLTCGGVQGLDEGQGGGVLGWSLIWDSGCRGLGQGSRSSLIVQCLVWFDLFWGLGFGGRVRRVSSLNRAARVAET